jgi:hypothetical protein
MNQTNHNTDVLEVPEVAVQTLTAPQPKPENKTNFDHFQLPHALKASLTKMKFTSPTPPARHASCPRVLALASLLGLAFLGPHLARAGSGDQMWRMASAKLCSDGLSSIR